MLWVQYGINSKVCFSLCSWVYFSDSIVTVGGGPHLVKYPIDGGVRVGKVLFCFILKVLGGIYTKGRLWKSWLTKHMAIYAFINTRLTYFLLPRSLHMDNRPDQRGLYNWNPEQENGTVRGFVKAEDVWSRNHGPTRPLHTGLNVCATSTQSVTMNWMEAHELKGPEPCAGFCAVHSSHILTVFMQEDWRWSFHPCLTEKETANLMKVNLPGSSTAWAVKLGCAARSYVPQQHFLLDCLQSTAQRL